MFFPTLKKIYLIRVTFFVLMMVSHSSCSWVGHRIFHHHPNTLFHNRYTPFIALAANFNCQTGQETYKGHLNIRIQRDSIIWFSLNHGIGTEIIRGKINYSGIELLDRLEKTYQKYDYKSLYNQLAITCDYALLQTILLKEWGKDLQSITLPTVGTRAYYWDAHITILTYPTEPQKVTIVHTTTGQAWSMQYIYKKGKKRHKFLGLQIAIGQVKVYLAYKDIKFLNDTLIFPFKIPPTYAKS